MHLHLCGGQEFWGNVGVVLDRDMEFWLKVSFAGAFWAKHVEDINARVNRE